MDEIPVPPQKGLGAGIIKTRGHCAIFVYRCASLTQYIVTTYSLTNLLEVKTWPTFSFPAL